MAEFTPWSDVAAGHGFQALTPGDQQQAREQYFNDVVRPRVPEEDLGAAREQFLRDTTSAAAPKQPRPLSSFVQDRQVDSDTSSVANDYLSSLKVGADTAAADLRELVGRVPLVGEKLKNAGDALDRAFELQSPDESLKQASKNFTPSYQESREKKWWDSKEGWFGPAWSDPRSYASGILESLPEEAMTIFPALKAAKGAYTVALAKTGSEKLAANAAARTALIIGGASEGALAGAQSSREVRESIMNTPEDTLRQSDALKSLMTQGMSFDQAKGQVANDAATKAFFLAGVSTGIFSGMGDRVLAKIILGGEGGLAKRVIKGAVAEGVLEEFPQSYLQQLSQNYAMREGNKDQDLFDDALNQGLAGLALGVAQGGAMAGALGRTRAPAKPDASPVNAGDVLGTEQSPSPAAPEAPGPPAPGGIESMLADPRKLFAVATQRPEILNTIEKALAEMPEAPAKTQAELDSALQSIVADPKAIFAIAQQRPDLYKTIAQAAAETGALTDEDAARSRSAAVTEQAAQGAQQRQDDLASIDEQAAQQKAAEQQQAQLQNTVAKSAADTAQPTAMSLAMEKAMERAGIQKRQPSASSAPVQATPNEIAPDAFILGADSRDVPDGLLHYSARKGGKQARLTAEAEVKRRNAVREAGLHEQDQEWAEKLFSRQRLNREEKRRAMEMGFGRERADGSWELTPAAKEYRAVLRAREKSGSFSDQMLVDRIKARLGTPVTVAKMPDTADAQAAQRVAQSFGKRVVWVDGEGFKGVQAPEDANTIYLNVRSSSAHLSVAGHELLHSLRRTNEAVYKLLLDRVRPLMLHVPEYRAWLKEETTKEGQKLSDKELDEMTHEELIADFLGDHMMQPKFWSEVFRGQEKSVVERIRDAILLALDSIRIRLQMGGKRGFGTEPYIKDMEAVRKALAEAFNSWQREAKEAERKVDNQMDKVVKAREDVSKARERNEPPVKETVKPKGVTITAETKPSTKLDIGKALENVDALKLAKYQKDALAAVFGDKGLAALRDAMGFGRTKFSYVEGTGAYEASISPNVVLTIDGSLNEARRLARAWMYVFKQDAVPLFRADEKLLDDPKAAAGFKFNLAKAPTPEQERALYDTLRKEVHDGIGYTKTGPSEFVVINFRGDDGKPFLSLTDKQLLERMQALVEGARFHIAVESFGAFGVQSEYPYHDWQTENSRSLRDSAAQGRPALQKWLDRWADSFQRFAQDRERSVRSADRKRTEGGRATGDRAGSVDQLAHEAATSPQNALPAPTPAQAASGNYKKGHVLIAGLDISIENPEGSRRRPEWPPLQSHYGYIRGTIGKDKDHLDVFIKPGTPQDYAGPVFVIDQKNASGAFDEHKVMLGWPTMEEARAGYEANYQMGWDGIRSIVLFDNPTDFKAWLEHGDTGAPVEPQAPLVRAREQTETAAFKKWFGDSKVVDAEGKPLVVYHGAEMGGKFNTFKVPETDFHVGPGMNDTMRSQYFFFSSDEQTARSYGAVKSVYLSIKNPLVVDAGGKTFKSFVPFHYIGDALRDGHDGVVVTNIRDDAMMRGAKAITYVALRPEQIKSAIGNRGTFNANEPSILRSREGVGRPGEKYEFGLELERRPNGDWFSPDGRFEIEREADGYYAKLDGVGIGWGRDFQRARAHLLAKFKEEVAAGNIINPAEAKSVFNRYTPEQQAAVATAWRKIATMPDAFRSGRSEAKGMKQIAADMGVDRVIKKIDGFDINEPDGHVGWISIDFNDETTATLHYFDADRSAYLNAAEMHKGGHGAALYQMALTWAKNNGYVLVPDPAGLSLTNTFRRTEQMTSAALRLGTTKYMRPHPDQGLYGWINEPKTSADESHNLALLLLTSQENVYEGEADSKRRTKMLDELSKIGYNFEHGRFEHATGTQVTNREWGHLAHLDQSSAVGSGVTTLQRAVLTKSILDEARDRGRKGVAALVSSLPARGIADEDHPLRGILYARERDTGGREVPGAGRAASGGAVRGAALATARAAVAATRPVTAALDLANRAADAALKVPAKLLIAPITSRLYDRVAGIRRALVQKSALAQEVSHGMQSDYGLDEPYLDARQDRENRINRVLRQSKEMIERIASLSRAEARVAYLWMQEKPDTHVEQQLLAQLPQEAQQTLAEMKEQIDQLGREAVELGLLSLESYERNHMAYLHRTYKKYALENPGAAGSHQQAAAIRAKAYRGRGMRDDIAASRVPGAQKGAMYTRLELREPSTEGLGKLKRVVYLPAGTAIPATYADWRHDGTWEARFFDPKHNDRVGMWRDLSPEERARLGEIDEVRYAFAVTMLATTRDIETARFLKWVGENHAKADEDAVIEAGGKIAEAVDSMVTLQTYADNEWVQVPAGYAAGTKIKKYGAIAGQYIPGHIWNDIRSTMNFRSGSAVWRLYDQLLRGWKISKTALSPAVHTNNIMSNFVLADIAEVYFEHIRKALRTIIDAQRGNDAALAIMERYYDSGAEGGSQSAIELRNEVIEPFLKELEREQDETLRQVGIMQAISLAARGNLRQALASISALKEVQLAAAPFKLMIEAYRSEDAVFRLAKFIKETDAGKSDREAGKEARKAFLDYNINAPWIQALRRGPLPFLAFSYRAIPLLVETAAKRPWKMMKYFAIGYGLNALAYAMLGSAGDEDKERRLMPEEKSGRALGVFYRMLRMPWNDEHGSPVFFDVRRWIPGGDIVDLNGSQSAIPLPSWLSVGGPLSLMVEFAANKSLFTGKPIVKESDSMGEAITKIGDELFKFSSPNLPMPSGAGWLTDALGMDKRLFQTYSWANVRSAATGETDAFGRERNLAQALASSVGVKLSSQPEDVATQNLIRKRDAQLREISETMGGIRRQYQRGGMDEDEYARSREQQNEKKQKVTRTINQRLGLEYR